MDPICLCGRVGMQAANHFPPTSGETGFYEFPAQSSSMLELAGSTAPPGSSRKDLPAPCRYRRTNTRQSEIAVISTTCTQSG